PGILARERFELRLRRPQDPIAVDRRRRRAKPSCTLDARKLRAREPPELCLGRLRRSALHLDDEIAKRDARKIGAIALELKVADPEQRLAAKLRLRLRSRECTAKREPLRARIVDGVDELEVLRGIRVVREHAG